MARKKIPWRQDPVILQRLEEVERRHFSNQSNYQIAAALGVTEATIRNDVKRLQERWLERFDGSQDETRARIAVELADVKARAIRAAEFDEAAERYVLYGDDPADGTVEEKKARRELLLERLRAGGKGAILTFKGAKAQSLNVARQALMDLAKLHGVVIEKSELTGKDGGPIEVRPDLSKLSKDQLLALQSILSGASRADPDTGRGPG